MGDGLYLPLFRRVGAADPPSGARVLDIGAAVPFERAAINGIIEKAGSSIGLPAQRRIGPRAAARAGDRFLVEPFGDRFWTGAGYELAKDAPDNLGFG